MYTCINTYINTCNCYTCLYQDTDGQPLKNAAAFEMLKDGAVALNEACDVCERAKAKLKLHKLVLSGKIKGAATRGKSSGARSSRG